MRKDGDICAIPGFQLVPGLSRFRVNAFRDRRGVGGVLRTISSKVPSADDLRLPKVIRDFTLLEKGLVVVTGPTGSGKSTTLAAMVDLINSTRTDHIITIEDPVEFVHEPKACLVNQREIHTHTHSFASALRAALREDPDIVLVGEMRHLETVAIARDRRDGSPRLRHAPHEHRGEHRRPNHRPISR
jgi:twitching motility protein PilT